MARCWFSNWPPQSRKYPGGRVTLAPDRLAGLGDEAAQVAAGDIALDPDPALAVLAADLAGPLDACAMSATWLRGTQAPPGVRTQDGRRSASSEFRRVLGVAELQVEELVALVDLGHGLAADGRLHDVLDVLDIEAEAGDPGPVGADGEIGLAGDHSRR